MNVEVMDLERRARRGTDQAFEEAFTEISSRIDRLTRAIDHAAGPAGSTTVPRT